MAVSGKKEKQRSSQSAQAHASRARTAPAKGRRDDGTERPQRNGGQYTGTSDEDYNVISVLYHALQGAELHADYIEDAEDAGDHELADFFKECQREERSRADRAKRLLMRRLRQTSSRGEEEMEEARDAGM